MIFGEATVFWKTWLKRWGVKWCERSDKYKLHNARELMSVQDRGKWWTRETHGSKFQRRAQY